MIAAWQRPVMACLLLSALAACGQTPQRATTHAARISSGDYARPSTYDAPGPSHDPWGPYITQASQRFDIPERWIREVMRQESGGRVSATSRVGAMGLMQVMPGTYRELQAKYGLGPDPYHPWDSLMAGTAYLREMYELYGNPAFLAAYNAGPRRLEDYLWSNRGLPAETRNYVARIGPRIQGASPNRRAAPEVYAAAEIPLNIPAGPRRGDTATMLALREQRNAVDPGVQVASLPPGPVVRMEPIPDGSSQAYSYAAPTQLASAGGGFVSQASAAAPARQQGSVIAMAPVASLGDFQTRMEPITSPGDLPQGGAYVPPATTQLAMAPITSPGDPGTPGAGFQVESLPAPPAEFARYASVGAAPARAEPAPAAPPAARTAAVAQPFVPVMPPGFAQPSPRGFSIIGQAQASTLPAATRQAAAPARAAAGNWGIQVGAFASENLARAAAGEARSTLRTAGTSAQVQPASQGRTILYRARVTGLADRDAAEQACQRMRRGACMVVAPGA
ncbi:transglycosylase SLT domain-containing protein [Falsiroseomonas sp. HC035]|uniref:transglycosylase SLT domain-containing protein n=1 Tax=Falsiroseomonas sp. HC035 TaxID=3390999 RepID=UPI003D323AE4